MNPAARGRYVPGVETDTDVDTDHGLLAAVAAGGEPALRVLYDRHSPAMLRLLHRLTGDSGVAEEILQESWLAVWRSAATFRGDSSVRGWLLGVARRQAHNRLRRFEPVRLALDAEEVPEPVDPGTDVEADVLASAGQRQILAAITALPRRHRDVAVLALVEELPYTDIAEALGIPVGTVKSRMAKARGRLGAALAEGQVS
ncbi:RNA polymerase sigma-70 factor (ECF subfamily) [Murinocardiopsis flavida]|uniref:RNA polymerase sigma-70 factor (ECF subfamily) n=1 Tax=Murinocardiopsis flavida TaxID=645275 RepID=A0A2P8DSN0_9ACTN|nr:RNA polymerase sigma-70 factor (ECF subfamily) [Murinocardiopsis flavida]